jgi:uncharacterized membrane protein
VWAAQHCRASRKNGKIKELMKSEEPQKGLRRIFALGPISLEFENKDFLQVIVGATLLAIPVMFTEEVWRLGESLHTVNIVAIALVSLVFISLFTYYNYYHGSLKGNIHRFLERVLVTYVMSILIVSLLLSLIDQAPWTINWVLAVKRVILISLPASMSAVVADILK